MLCAWVVLFRVGDPRLISLAYNSLLLAAGTCAVALPLGSALAVLLTRTNIPGRKLAAWVIAALIVLPLYIQYSGWDAGFGARGWITAAFGHPMAEPLLNGWRGAIFVHAMAATAWATLIVSLGLRSVEPGLEQEALQDSSPLVVIVRVTLPRCSQWLAVAALWIAVTTTAEMQITDMYQIRTYAEEVYLGFNLGDELLEASYSGLGQIALVGGLVAAALATVASLSPRRDQADDRTRSLFALGPYRLPATCLVWGLLLALLGFPLGNLVAQAGMSVITTSSGVEQHWSLWKAAGLLPAAVVEYRAEIGWSLLMASTAATVAVVIGAPLAWWARRSSVASLVLIILASFALAVPGPLVGSGIIELFNEPPLPFLRTIYNNSIAAPVLAMTIRAIPLVLLLLWRAMHSVAQESLESASLEGASAGERMWRMGLASQWPAVAAAWLLGVALGMGELAGTILTTPPGVQTVAIRIFGLAHAGVDDQLAALCLVCELIFLLLAGLVYGVLQYGSTRR